MTLFTQSLGGSITGSGALTKQANKAPRGTITATGRYFADKMTVTGRITPVGTLALSTSKALTGRSALRGQLSPTVPGGGAQQIESGGTTLAVGGLRRG